MRDSNLKKIRFVLIVTLILNICVTITKLILGSMTNSSSIFADGFHSLSDGFNNIVGIIALTLAYKPADENHPYGHKKIETMLSMFISIVLFFMGFTILKDNILHFNQTVDLNISNLSIAVMVGTMIINIFVTRYELHKGRQLNSSFLISDAKHTMSDVYITLSVIASLVGIKFLGLPNYFDNIMSFIVVFFIFKAGFEIFIDAAKILTDERLLDPKDVAAIVNSFDQVYDCHMIKSRGFEDNGFLELHIEVDPLMTVRDSHKLNHEIEKKINRKLDERVSVVIHIEPIDHVHE